MRPSELSLAAAIVAAFLIAGPASAQEDQDPGSGAMSDFAIDSDQPVTIEADELEVRDADKIAEFVGNVVVTQGETTMRTARLKVFYTGDATEAATGGGSGASGDISRLEAEGKVVVSTGDQEATGEWAVFEMATQEITLGGGVVLSQGDNVLTGTSLVVDLDTGTSRLVAGGGGGDGRVKGLFIPGSMGQKQE